MKLPLSLPRLGYWQTFEDSITVRAGWWNFNYSTISIYILSDEFSTHRFTSSFCYVNRRKQYYFWRFSTGISCIVLCYFVQRLDESPCSPLLMPFALLPVTYGVSESLLSRYPWNGQYLISSISENCVRRRTNFVSFQIFSRSEVSRRAISWDFLMCTRQYKSNGTNLLIKLEENVSKSEATITLTVWNGNKIPPSALRINAKLEFLKTRHALRLIKLINISWEDFVN